MKRIGILTYHKSNNYGAYLQCYSLINKLKESFPNEYIEVVDYMSKEAYSLYHPSIWNYLYLISHAQNFRRKLRYTKMFFSYLKSLIVGNNNVESFLFDGVQSSLTLSPQQFVTDDYKSIAEYLNRRYDILVVGSDAVWNWQIRPFPNVYFLGSKIKTRKLSYAASSYNQLFNNLSTRTKKEIKNSWQTFDYIGVRDNTTEQFVSLLTPECKTFHNCDPTVYLDLSKLPVDREIILAKLIKVGFDTSKKTIGLMGQPWLAKYVKDRLGKEYQKEYQIVSVFKKSEYADVNLMDINPFEWAICFSFFDITVTHYFHGNLLSIKNGIPTIVIEQKSYYNQLYNSKIRDFMTRINKIENCHYIEDLKDDYNLKEEIESLISQKNYREEIRNALEKESLSFRSFEGALKSIIDEKIYKKVI